MSKSDFWDDTPPLSHDQVDKFVHDEGFVSTVHGPRQNNERARIQYHDFRSSKEKQRDERTAKQIAKLPVNER